MVSLPSFLRFACLLGTDLGLKFTSQIFNVIQGFFSRPVNNIPFGLLKVVLYQDKSQMNAGTRINDTNTSDPKQIITVKFCNSRKNKS